MAGKSRCQSTLCYTKTATFKTRRRILFKTPASSQANNDVKLLPVMATETRGKSNRTAQLKHNDAKKCFNIVKYSPPVLRVNSPLVKYLLLFFMVDSGVVVVDSRCWVLVARATVAMAPRLHQGNCCYPPSPCPPPSLLWLAECFWFVLKSQSPKFVSTFTEAFHARVQERTACFIIFKTVKVTTKQGLCPKQKKKKVCI